MDHWFKSCCANMNNFLLSLSLSLSGYTHTYLFAPQGYTMWGENLEKSSQSNPADIFLRLGWINHASQQQILDNATAKGETTVTGLKTALQACIFHLGVI